MSLEESIASVNKFLDDMEHEIVSQSNEAAASALANLEINNNQTSTPKKRKQPLPPPPPIKGQPMPPIGSELKKQSARAKIAFDQPSKAVMSILSRLHGFPDEIREVQTLRNTLQRVRSGLTITQLVHRWLQDIVLDPESGTRDYSVRELLLLCYCYADSPASREVLRKALSVPTGLSIDENQLEQLPVRKLFSHKWPNSKDQARAVTVMRGLSKLFIPHARDKAPFATPMIFWDGTWAYTSVDDCVKAKNRL